MKGDGHSQTAGMPLHEGAGGAQKERHDRAGKAAAMGEGKESAGSEYPGHRPQPGTEGRKQEAPINDLFKKRCQHNCLQDA